MRILYITDGGPGGVSSHVRCLTQCLKGVAEVMVCITYGSDALKKMLDEDGTPYCWCRCRNGHDLRLLLKVRRLIKEFRPEVIHFHDIPLFVVLYVKMLRGVRVFCTLHTPSARKVAFSRNVLNHAVQPCYFLPVSSQTWEVFKAAYPKARGEVFFNPVRIGEAKSKREGEQRNDSSFVVGMVGRNADQKDWPSFHKVEEIVKGKVSRFRGFGVGADGCNVEFLNAGEKEVCDGRAAIAKMDLFVMTSKHEQLPTTVLECFMLGTPICGFLPVGGTKDILEFSKGPLREAFIRERDCDKLSDIVIDLLVHPEKRQALVEDGWQILVNHFDAEKNCRGRLMEIYKTQSKCKSNL